MLKVLHLIKKGEEMKLCSVTTLLLTFLILSCQTNDISEVKKGMSKPDIEYLVGKPKAKKQFANDMELWHYNDEEAIVFNGNFVYEVHTTSVSKQRAEQDLNSIELTSSQSMETTRQ